MTVRVAVIGCGIMGADHARVLVREVPGAVVQVVCDPDPVAVRRVADELGVAHGATHPFEIAGRSDVDAVLIASPDGTHAALAIDAMDHGKPALVEKPLAPGPGDCLPILEAETRMGHRMLTVGFMRRYDPGYQAMRRAGQAGDIGVPLVFRSIHRNVDVPDWFDGPMAITNSASHDFDIARYLLGAELTQVHAVQTGVAGQHAASPPVLLTLRTEAGHLVTIEVHVAAGYGYDVRGELVGTKASAELVEPRDLAVNSGLAHRGAFAPDWRPRFAEAYRRQNSAWVAGVEAGRPDALAASAWDGYVATQVAATAVAAVSSGQTEAIQLAPRPELYR